MKFGRADPQNDDLRAAALQLTAIRHQAAATAWRESMIEAAGDFMCGAAHGPSRADAETLNRLEAAERSARLAYTRFVIESALRRHAAAATMT
ncbi:MAG: hypothetical protein KKC85_17855 [Gammaproteobacteria bacterium]|nr:hypothetical protein [Gammaproteobacteria bacterium]MBU1442956.1 hypothetical protein [Gammaproteobacteria bacterium]MBU2288278.1 hypothetical protein [Gammaproteobacteria bacterium]